MGFIREDQKSEISANSLLDALEGFEQQPSEPDMYAERKEEQDEEPSGYANEEGEENALDQAIYEQSQSDQNSLADGKNEMAARKTLNFMAEFEAELQKESTVGSRIDEKRKSSKKVSSSAKKGGSPIKQVREMSYSGKYDAESSKTKQRVGYTKNSSGKMVLEGRPTDTTSDCLCCSSGGGRGSGCYIL